MKTKYELLDSAMYLYPSHAQKTLKYKKVSVRLIILLAILGGALCYAHHRTYQRDFRSKVREMTKHAWDGYYNYAGDSDELRPVTHAGYNWTALPLYINAVDSLDTLFLMGLTKEYEQAKEIVRNKLHFDHLDFQINIFETNIRILGGLLGAYELDADPLFIEKAVQFADIILPAFDTKSGIPVVEYNLATREMGSQIVTIASVGTLQLELQYLSDITGNPEYQDKALYALEQLMNLPKDIPGLFPQLVNVEKMKFETPLMYTIGAGSDSFYEYLLKLYLSTGNEKFKNWFVSSSTAIKEHLVHHSEKYTYIDQMAELSFFEHLSCFAGAMFSTSGVVLDRPEDFIVGVNFTDTCADSYRKSKYGLGGEKSFVISNNIYVPSPSYHHRPEVIESVFYMWRYSGDEKYRIFGEEMIKSLEKYCRNDIGYHSLNNNGLQFNRQETFLIAETFKYLYLLFSDDNTIPRKKILI